LFVTKNRRRKKKATACLRHHLLHFKMKQEDDGVFFFSSRRKEKKTKRGKKNAEKGGILPFFSHFCIWDEVCLFPFPLHVPSTLSSPPSSSLVSRVSLKLCVTQAQELSQALEMQ